MAVVNKIKEWVRWNLPFSWIYGQKHRQIVDSHTKVGNYWNKVINDYFDGKIKKYHFKPKVDLKGEQVIWQYWGQGVDKDELPELVKVCFDSVDNNARDFRIIRLSDETVGEYVDIPQWVMDKVKNDTMRRVFFSDLLRMILLNCYGGLWLDATVLMTSSFPKEFMTGDHFCYQRSSIEPYKESWERTFIYYYSWRPGFQVNMLSSILWSKPRSEMMAVLADLLLYFWSDRETEPSFYFFLQILYNRLIEGKLAHLRPKVVSDCLPHILHMLIRGARLPYTYSYALDHSSLHKLTYFSESEIDELRRALGEG